MKRTGGLFARIVAFENLLAAERRAARGKRDRPSVARFGFWSRPVELGHLRIYLLSLLKRVSILPAVLNSCSWIQFSLPAKACQGPPELLIPDGSGLSG